MRIKVLIFRLIVVLVLLLMIFLVSIFLYKYYYNVCIPTKNLETSKYLAKKILFSYNFLGYYDWQYAIDDNLQEIAKLNDEERVKFNCILAIEIPVDGASALIFHDLFQDYRCEMAKEFARMNIQDINSAQRKRNYLEYKKHSNNHCEEKNNFVRERQILTNLPYRK